MQNQREYILNYLECLSDLEFQKDTWIDGKEFHVAFCIGELQCLLGDHHFYEMVKHDKLFFKEDTLNKYLKDVAQSFLNFKEPTDIREILTDPEWLTLVEKAKVIVQNYDKIQLVPFTNEEFQKLL